MSFVQEQQQQQQIQLTKIGNVCIVTMTGSPHKANVFTLPLLQHFDSLLDKVQTQHMPCALVITGTGNFFSAGFDLQALLPATTTTTTTTTSSGASSNNNKNNTKDHDLVEYAWKVLAKLLVFPTPTIALMNGHAFGLGLFLGLACDYRLMMTTTTKDPVNNGAIDSNNNHHHQSPPTATTAPTAPNKEAKLCLPEIHLGLPLGSGFAALATCKMSRRALRTSALTGKQWNCDEAFKAGIIDDVVVVPHKDQNNNHHHGGSSQQIGYVPHQVLKMAEQLVPTATKGNLHVIKMELYGDAHAALTRPQHHTQQQRSKL